jgi:endo-beta-N-acetylglucosaminidase D
MRNGYVDFGDGFPQGAPIFDTYTHTFWSHVDLFVYFEHKCQYGPRLWINAAPKNGVPCLGNMIVETAGERDDPLKAIRDGQIPQIAAKMVQAMVFFGLDGWFMNVEAPGGGPPRGPFRRDSTEPGTARR